MLCSRRLVEGSDGVIVDRDRLSEYGLPPIERRQQGAVVESNDAVAARAVLLRS